MAVLGLLIGFQRRLETFVSFGIDDPSGAFGTSPIWRHANNPWSWQDDFEW
jgi:hypothetical protein